MAKHTPGPWQVRTIDGSLGSVDAFNVCIAQAQEVSVSDRSAGHLERCANARLISAAPDLLDAAECAARVLFLLEREVSALGLRAGNVRERLSAAIAKAGGDDGRWHERLEEARSDLCDAINELEQP